MGSGRNWTPAEDRVLQQMRPLGKTSAEMAAMLPGRTAEGVKGRLFKLGLAMPKDALRALRVMHAARIRELPSYGEKRGQAISAAYSADRRVRAGEQAKRLRLWEIGAQAQSMDAKRAAALKGSAANQSKRYGWCPPHLLGEYKRLTHGGSGRFSAAEARRIIEDQWVTELRRALRQIAAVAPLAMAEAKRQAEAERAHRRSFAAQMERVKAGAALVPTLRMSRPIGTERSLTGNAEAML